MCPCLFPSPIFSMVFQVKSSHDGPPVPNPQCPPAVSALPLQSPGGWQLYTAGANAVYCVQILAM